MKTQFRVVLDTNIIISAQSNNPTSPNRELLKRWVENEFQLIYSDDTLFEYIEKLLELGFPRADIIRFVVDLRKKADHVDIRHYHYSAEQYPRDPDDIAFILCADNGEATHLISYDPDILEVRDYHVFNICKPLAFLRELRETLNATKNSEESLR